MKRDIPEQIEVPTADLIDWVFDNFEDHGEADIPSMDSVDSDEFYDGIDRSNVMDIEIHDFGVVVYGTFKVREVTGRIPAGPNRGYGPINPPEVITKDRKMAFDVSCPWNPWEVPHATVDWY